MNNSWTYIDFPEGSGSLQTIIEKKLHVGIGVMEDRINLMHNTAYRFGHYDGIIPFYEKDRKRFPTGLIKDVDSILGELQGTHQFQYQIIDDRPDPIITSIDIPEQITFTDTDTGNLIELRDYQMEAINNVVKHRDGILHLSTGCLPAHTNILTTTGYKTFSEILEEAGLSEDSPEGYHGNPKGIKLINRYGEPEEPSDITVNGTSSINKITTERGYNISVTDTHPLMTIDNTGSFKWKKSKDIEEGDWIVLRQGDNVYEENSSSDITEEDAYVLGMLIADGYLATESMIMFTNNQEELIKLFMEYFKENIGLNPRKVIDSESQSGTYDCTIQHKEHVVAYKNKYGLESALSKGKEVPYSIRTAPKNIQKAFITGYLECEMFLGTGQGTKLGIEVTSASKKLIEQVHIMLLNLGIVSTLREKVVKGYEHNWYGRIMVGVEETEKLLNMLEFRTATRNQSKKEFFTVFNSKKRNNQGQRVPYGKELANEYWQSSKTPYEKRAELRKHFHTPKYISKVRLRDGLLKYPDGDSSLLSKLMELTKEEYVFSRVTNIEKLESEPTFDFHMPKTNSYIAEGIINHNSGKSFSAAGLILQALPHIYTGETIAFFVHKRDLFTQTVKVLESALGTSVGKIGSGQHLVKQVNVVMVPTVASSLRIDVEKGLRFTPKQMVVKKMATQIAPEYTRGKNQRTLLQNHVMNMEIKTKADEAFRDEIQKVIAESESDAKCIFNLNAYTVEYNKILREKNEDKFKKKERMEEFLDTVVLGIFDEAHSVQGDGYYMTALACENALMKVGLTGSIDRKNKLLVQRMKSVFHEVSSVTRNVDMIDRGVLANTEVMMAPIRTTMINGEEVDISGLDWQNAYESGIVQNEYRNALGAKMAQMWYDRDEVVLIVVSRIEHGERMSQLLDGLGVKHRYIHGESDQGYRDETISNVRQGDLEVLISSTIIDEGIDIPNLSVLVNMAGGKSLRQILQRLGRVIRKKEDGRKATIIDFYDRTQKHLYKHSKERYGIYKDEEFPLKVLD